MLINIQHARTIPNGKRFGYCSYGIKRFFKLHNLDLRKFIKTGLSEEEILATGDIMATKLVEWAHVRR